MPTPAHGRGRAVLFGASWFALLLLAAGCAGRVADTTASRSDPLRDAVLYAGPDREQKLAAAAQQEGSVTWYTSHALPITADVMRGFEAKYPGVKVELFRGDTSEILAKLTEESRANKAVADVIETTLPTVRIIQESGLIVEYYLPNADAFPANAKSVASGRNVYWAVDREHYISFGYNTTLLQPGLVPSDWNGILVSGLRNQLALPGSSTGVNFMGYLQTFLAPDFLPRLQEQNVKLMMISGGALTDLVAKGEVAASPTLFLSEVARARQSGASVEWVPLNPVTANAGAALVSKTAPHPNAAALFATWLLGEDGQRVLAESHVGLANVDPGFTRWYPGEDVSGAQYEELYEKWRKQMTDTFVR